jgi:hypothetical protein
MSGPKIFTPPCPTSLSFFLPLPASTTTLHLNFFNLCPDLKFLPESDLNMAPVTEIAYITLKPGVQLTGSSAEAKAWAESLSTGQAQEGYQRTFWGTTLENETLLMLLIGTLPLLPSSTIPTPELLTTC